LRHLPKDKLSFGDRRNVIDEVDIILHRQQPPECAVTLYQRDELDLELVCARHSVVSHGRGPEYGCWRATVFGSSRDCGDKRSRIESDTMARTHFS
jgi:hypothetical protein